MTPTLPSTTSTVCPDMGTGRGGSVQETPPEPKLKTYKNYLENMLGLIKHLVQEGASSVMFLPVKDACTHS